MLPFLKQKKSGAAIVTNYNSSGFKKEQEPEENQGSSSASDAEAGLLACAQDLIKALEKKDSLAVASALKSAFEICDSQPHQEGEHVDY